MKNQNICQTAVSRYLLSETPQVKVLETYSIIRSLKVFVLLLILSTQPIMARQQVGTLDVSATVNESGGALVSIPVDVPIGIGGIQPNLSLVYNSQGGYGIAGWGWNLSGLSSISRVGGTPYYDRYISNITFDSSDNLMLDGQRLILMSGNNLQNGAHYHTEVETFSDVTFLSDESGFQIDTKDGSTIKYGTSENTRLQSTSVNGGSASSKSVLAWNISYIADRNGNYMTFLYDVNDTSGESYIREIDYTGNGSVEPIHKVVFEYIDMPQEHITYLNGMTFSQTRILKKIKILTANTKLYEYELDYEGMAQSDIHPKLVNVMKIASNGDYFSPITFHWNEPTQSTPSIINISHSSDFNNKEMPKSSVYGDFNGDGKIDMFTYDTSSTVGLLYLNLSADNPSSRPFITCQLQEKPKDIKVADYDGDGIHELIVKHGATMITRKLNCYKWDADKHVFSYSLLLKDNSLDTFIPGDFDGDGKEEILLPEKKLMLCSGRRNVSVTCSIPWDDAIGDARSKADNGVPTDFNGNGKTDIFIATKDAIYVYEMTKTNDQFVQILSGTLSQLGLVSPNSRLFGHFQFGDINGDAKTDIICTQQEQIVRNGAYTWMARIFLNDDKKFRPYIIQPGGKYAYVSDCNNDGLSDYLFLTDENSAGWFLNIGLSNGYGFSFTQRAMTGFSGNAINPSDIGFYNLYGDGRGCFTQYKTLGKGHGATLCRYPIFSSNPWLLTSVTDGLGASTHILYEPISNKSVYTQQFTPDKNVTVLRGSLYVVSALETSCTHLDYLYKDALVHRSGKGFLGFLSSTVIDRNNMLLMNTERKLDDTHYCLMPFRSTTYATANAQAFANPHPETNTSWKKCSQTVVTSDNKSVATKVFWPYISKTVEKDLLTTLTSTTEYTFNNDGNQTSETTTTGNLVKYSTWTYPSQSKWLKNLPVKEEVYSSLDGVKSAHRTKEMTYDSRGNLTEVVYDRANTKCKSTNIYSYDVFGHIIKETSTISGQKRSASSTYSADGRFLLSSTDALGMTNTYVYDAATGLLRTATSALGTTSYVYDSFGRLTLTKMPDQTESYTSMDFITGSADVNYRIETGGTNAPCTVSYYNFKSQEVCRMLMHADTDPTFVVTRYDDSGRVQWVSEPFFASGWRQAINRTLTHGNATETCYDMYGRIESIKAPGSETHYVYDNLRTSCSTEEGATITCLNSSGLTIQKINIDKNGGAKNINYAYYPTGLVKSITPDGSPVITFDYDLHGNRTKMVDPDAGTVECTFNAFDQLLTQSHQVHGTGSPVKTTYTYQTSTGLLSQEKTVGQTTMTKRIVYDSKYKDMPVKLSYDENNSIQMNYDTHGRLSSKKEILDGKTMTTRYIYEDGLLIQKVMDDHTINYTYDEYGCMLCENADHQIVWQHVGENARGQVTVEKHGPLTTNYTYDASGRLCCLTTPGVVDLKYSYDGSDNVTSKTDRIAQLKVSYSYDKFNRLTSWSIGDRNTFDDKDLEPILIDESDKISLLSPAIRTSAPVGGTTLQKKAPNKTFSMSYDAQTGNITSKSDLGTSSHFCYGGTQPHALQAVENVATDWGTQPVQATYNDFNKLESLTDGHTTYRITYRPDGSRGLMTIQRGGKTEKRYYGDNREIFVDSLGATHDYTYLCHGAIVYKTMNGSQATNRVIQCHHDAQGSLIALTLGQGVVCRYAYDPWGKRVSPADWVSDDTRDACFHITRGYTMHEHLDDFGLINMNGRVYDPNTAQFLSPDNYVQSDGNWLNYNRYAYCYNNPLKYTDPSGEIAITASALVMGAVSSGIMCMGMNSQMGMGKAGFINDMKNFGVGACIGAAGMFAGNAASCSVSNALPFGGFCNGAISGAAGGAAGGMIEGCGMAYYGGASLSDALRAGAMSAGWGALSSGIFGGINRGFAASLQGLNFWNGWGEPEEIPALDLLDLKVDIPNKSRRAMDEDLKRIVEEKYESDKTLIDKVAPNLTTKRDDIYKITSDGLFLGDNGPVAGYFRGRDNGGGKITISPKALYAGDVHFSQVFEHELTHACHYYYCNSYFSKEDIKKKVYKACTEIIAYEHSSNVYALAGADYLELSGKYHQEAVKWIKQLPTNYTPPVELKPYYYY